MKSQTPAEGILLNHDYGDSKHYTVVCDCSSNDHSQYIWVDSDEYGVTVTIYSQQKTNFWSKTRWKHLWTLLTKGYIEVESDIILREQAALNYIDTLKKAIQDVKTFKKSR